MARVALTSTSDRIPLLSEIVTRHGLDPVGLPCIEVEPADDGLLAGARAKSVEADWLLVTSRRAVEAVWPEGGMPDTPVAAVGASTAAAVAGAGGNTLLMGEGGAGDLIEKLGSDVSGKRVLFPHASGADLSTVRRLQEAGAEVIALAVYETRPTAPSEDPVDAVMFGSPSAVAGWCQSRSLDEIVLAAIGETTGAALAHNGHEPDVIPPRPDFELLAALLADHLRERSSV